MARVETDWRAGLRSGAEQQSYLLESGALSDCSFTVVGPAEGETQEFLLHRVILARSSEVFEAMLLPSGERMSEAMTGRVTITDIEPRIFHIALKFIYADEDLTSLEVEDVMAVCWVADKYSVWSLQTACDKRLRTLITPNCVWRLLQLSETLQGYQELKESCLKMLQLATPACLRSEDLDCATEDSMVLLLQQASLAIDSELSLIGAVVRWARHQSSLSGTSSSSVRSVLEPRVLPLLRLLSLNEELLEAVCGLAESWLSDSERAALRARDLTSLPDTFSRCVDKRTRIPDLHSRPASDSTISRINTPPPRYQRYQSNIPYGFTSMSLYHNVL